MFKLIFDNFAFAVLCSFFSAILTLIVSGEHMGNALFMFYTVTLWIAFVIFDLVKGKHKKEAV